MNIIIAMDSFKGSLSSLEAGEAVREGALRADPEAGVVVVPMADGGEGTARTLTDSLGGRWQTPEVTGPLGERVRAGYGIVENSDGGREAVMEMAQAAGLALVPREKRNPFYTTTFGVGEMIRDALDRGCRRFIVGIGGSATNDGGAGMLQALGFSLTDEDGMDIPPGAAGLLRLAAVNADNADPRLEECRFRIACDVTNPLCGPDGSSRVFGPQKGADEKTVELMEAGLRHFSDVAGQAFPDCDPDMPGAGAAGGLGFGFCTFLNAELVSGIDLVMEAAGLREKIKDADLVITGEGRLDGQTVMGKVPAGVARAAKDAGKPVIALAGSLSEDAGLCNGAGIDAVFSILREPVDLETAMKKENAAANLAAVSEQVVRLVKAG